MHSPPLLFRQLFDRTSCTYTYLLAHLPTGRALLIDPVDTNLDRDLTLLQEHNLTLIYALNTHAHADHISATGLIKRRLPTVQSIIGASSGAKASRHVSHGDRIHIGADIYLSVIETPGHTEGCISYYLPTADGYPAMVFTGDALLIRGCGRTDFQGGSAEALFRSVTDRLFKLPPETLVFPAHDYCGMQCSTVAEEMAHNPRLKLGISEDRFKEIMRDLKLAYPKMFDTAVPANLNCGIPPDL